MPFVHFIAFCTLFRSKIILFQNDFWRFQNDFGRFYDFRNSPKNAIFAKFLSVFKVFSHFTPYSLHPPSSRITPATHRGGGEGRQRRRASLAPALAAPQLASEAGTPRRSSAPLAPASLRLHATTFFSNSDKCVSNSLCAGFLTRSSYLARSRIYRWARLRERAAKEAAVWLSAAAIDTVDGPM